MWFTYQLSGDRCGHGSSISTSCLFALFSHLSSPLSMFFYFILLLLSPLMEHTSGEILQITDQEAYIGKLYYHRLPELKLVEQIDIKEVEKSQLPDWLFLRKTQSWWELIGLPQAQDEGDHFFMVTATLGNGSLLKDVFRIQVSNYYHHFTTQSPESSSSSSIHKINNNAYPGNCIIRLVPSFAHIDAVWKLIDYLISSKMRREINLSSNYNALNIQIDTPDPSKKVLEWSYPLFTITDSADQLQKEKQYHITIDKQSCDSKITSDPDDFRLKLRELGVQFHHIEIIKPLLMNDESIKKYNQYGAVQLEPSKVHIGHDYPASLDTNGARKQRHASHKYAPHIYTTPTLNFELESTRRIDDYFSNPIAGNPVMTRFVPSLTSPSAFAASRDKLDPQPLPGITPLLTYRNSFTSANLFNPQFYTTPTTSLEPPTLIFDGASTPILKKPIKPSAVPYSPKLITPIIVPTPTASNLMSSTPSLAENEAEPIPTIIPEIGKAPAGKPSLPQNKPELRQRLPKFAITAGKYWTYKIPISTFYDQEDGTTSRLRLSLYRVSSLKERIHITKDSWFQLDSENQVLMAFPTENDVGNYENQFVLEAVDSSGLSTAENITVIVRQHQYARKFPFTITFYRVQWDPLKFGTSVKALRNFAQIITQIYGDDDLNKFVIQTLEKETYNGQDLWRIITTNDSIPAYPCPKQTIQSLYTRLASYNKPRSGQYAAPSELLSSKTGKLFKIEGLGLSIDCSKSPTSSGRPQLRNPIDIMAVNLGDVFRYKVKPDMFFAGAGRTTYDLDLSLYDEKGHALGRHSFIKFNDKTFEITGVAVDHRSVKDHQFFLVARDRETQAETSDSFVISVKDAYQEDQQGFYVTIGLKLFDEMDIDYKLDIANRIATLIFKDSDWDHIRVIKIVKRNYTLIPNADQQGESGQSENDIVSRKRRTESFDHQENSFDQMYEFTWTNKTDALLVQGNKCPSQPIQNSIITKLYGGSVTFSTLEKIFSDKYRLMTVEFYAVGKCLNYFSNRALYRDNLKPNFISIDSDQDGTKEPHDFVDGEKTTINESDIRTNELEDYYVKTMAPLIVLVGIFLVLTCVIICILLKCRRGVDKDRFEVRLGVDDYPTEEDIFIQKGRVPVIFESDLQQHLFSNQPSLAASSPSSFLPRQNVPMRHMSTPYQSLTPSQRRQPPPYKC